MLGLRVGQVPRLPSLREHHCQRHLLRLVDAESVLQVRADERQTAVLLPKRKGRLRTERQFCYIAQTDLREYLSIYKNLSSASLLPDGLICKDSLKVIQVRSLMKMELNRIDKHGFLEAESLSIEMAGESPNRPKIRDLFIQILEKYSKESYVCHESLEKVRLMSDQASESVERSTQVQIKQANLEFSKNFKLLTDALKVCLENLVLQDHAAAIREIFGITENHSVGAGTGQNGSGPGQKETAAPDQDLMHTLIPNFLAYFARTRLRLLSDNAEIMFLLLSISGQKMDLSQIAKDLGQPGPSTTSSQSQAGLAEHWLKYLFAVRDRPDLSLRGIAGPPLAAISAFAAADHAATRKPSSKWVNTPDKKSLLASNDGEQPQHSRGTSFAVPQSAEKPGMAEHAADQIDVQQSSSLRDHEFRKFVDQLINRHRGANYISQQLGFITPKRSVAEKHTSTGAAPDQMLQELPESLHQGTPLGQELEKTDSSDGEEPNIDEDGAEAVVPPRKHSESANQNSGCTAEFKVLETTQLATAPGVADSQIPVDLISQICRNLVVGSELLKAEFFRALVEYHKKREDDRTKKKEIVKKSLYKLADEIHTILMKNLEIMEANIISKSGRACVLCEGADDHAICGKLIHLRKEEWIHANCALWSEGVVESSYDGGLSNVYQMIKKVKGNTCPECGKGGASMTGHSDANKRYHFVCALKNKCVFSVKTEKKITNLDVWVKNTINVFQKHYKNCSVLYFLFCISSELITTFKNNRKVYILKKQSKGIAEPARAETLIDLSSSIRELQSSNKIGPVLPDSEVDQLIEKVGGVSGFGQMTRIGNLMLLGVWDITQPSAGNSSDVGKNLAIAASIRKQWLKLLRKEGLPQSAKYTEEQKELLCLALRKYMVVKLVPVQNPDDSSTKTLEYHVFELDVNLTRPTGIFSAKVIKLSKAEFLTQLESIYLARDFDLKFRSTKVSIVEQHDMFSVLFNDMGLRYSEVRAYLNLHLQAQLDKHAALQLTSKNLLHYRNVFYNCIDEQQILLDIREKYSIYDRIKLIWQINSDLETSREFIKDMSFAQDPRRFGTRSKINPKSRSFCDRSLQNLNNSDGSRGSEKLINELIGSTTLFMNNKGVADPSGLSAAHLPGGRGRSSLTAERSFGGKKNSQSSANPNLSQLGSGSGLNPVSGGFPKGLPEKNLNPNLRKGYNSHKTTNIIVAPSNIHKYGLFAAKDFLKDEFVVEYIGEIIRIPVSDVRERQYEREGFRDCFMFKIHETDLVIDATFIGNQARYLNHSCDVGLVADSAKLRFDSGGDRRPAEVVHLRAEEYRSRRRTDLRLQV